MRMIGTHIDITPLKLIEDRLREAEESQRTARKQAESANLAKSEFLAKISHEVRTPLHGALAAFQMLRGMELSNEARQLVEMGDASSRWMLDIIGESLDIARIEAGRMELNESDFLFGPLMAEVAETASIAARENKIQIRWEIGTGFPAGGFGDRSEDQTGDCEPCRQRHQIHRRGRPGGGGCGADWSQHRETGPFALQGGGYRRWNVGGRPASVRVRLAATGLCRSWRSPRTPKFSMSGPALRRG